MMKFNFSIQKPRELSRIAAILLAALCVVEGFFLWLVVFPKAVDYQAVDEVAYEEIYGTREVDVSEIAKTTAERQRAAAWREFAEQLQERYAGENYAVAFASMSDDLTLEVNADQEFVAASTYKLFAAYAMFKSGDAPDCLDAMIIYSQNECALDYLSRYGWGRLGIDARSIGAGQTWFDETTHTTAHDLVVILRQVYDGSLLNEADNQRLLDDMKQQIFRDGIPAGLPEAVVADKVGFLDNLLHDTGIVYSPKGDFVLVVLTDGYSWESIAQTASEIYVRL
jgi:hypothetical protein